MVKLNVIYLVKGLCLIVLAFPHYAMAQYKGSASVTQGVAKTTASNLYTCSGGRTTNMGSIKAQDSSQWTVPAINNFSNGQFPWSSDLHNVCTGKTYANANAAIAVLDGTDVISIDSAGELITAYIFADNYFELYINGVPVGKDKVPYTQFNSSVVRFKVKRPFVIAFQLIDWEEHLGLGSELNGGFAYHPGDGGLVAVFKDAKNNTVAKTGSDWKAQTFYTSPIKDLTCPTENGTQRLTANCNTADATDGSLYYGLHWSKPTTWMNSDFDDADWPNASVYSNATVGVNNKPAYTNFTAIFDDAQADAEFIWSTNLILDNEVVVRYKVNKLSSQLQNQYLEPRFKIHPNPSQGNFEIQLPSLAFQHLLIINTLGQTVFETKVDVEKISLNQLTTGIYFVKIISNECTLVKKIVIQ